MMFWDPAETWAAEIIALVNIYETLVKIDPADNNKAYPVLAESWKESADHLGWTFKLREGVKFHSGLELTADVAVKSLKRTIDSKAGASYIWDGVKEIKAKDKYTIEFVLERPLPMLFIAGGAYGAYIYNPGYAKDWYYKPSADGTGPYKLKSYTKSNEILLEKFDGYWGGWKDPNKFDYAILKVVPERATARQMLEKGEADLAYDLTPDDIKALEKNPAIKIYRTESFSQLDMLLNCQKAPLNNKLVRQALAYLMPYQDIIKNVLGGAAVQARGVIPPTLWGYGKDLFQYTYDPAKAKQLLAQAGYPKGGLKLRFAFGATNSVAQKIAELYKDSLAQVGITLELQRMATIDTSYAQAKDPDPKKRQDMMTLYWWPDYVDPFSYLYSQFYTEKKVGFNFSYYYNPAVDKLIDEGGKLTGVSQAEATKKFIEAQKIIIEDSPAILLFCDMYVKAALTTLKGYKDNPAYATAVYFYELSRQPK
jgi:peptide/nickel transport system substrate-binding protein